MFRRKPWRERRPVVERLEARTALSGLTAAVDFEGDGLSNPSFVDLASSQWTIRRSDGTPAVLHAFGASNLQDVPVPGDYDGVGHTEQAVFRPSTGEWFVLGPNGGHLLATLGAPGLEDIPAPGDYDGVGHAEPAVFRPSTGQWFVLGPKGGHCIGVFGACQLADVPAPGDYDGVGYTEPAVFRVATAEWFVRGPNGGHSLGVFGAPNLKDVPAPGDYDGVGHAEPAVFRISTAEWFVRGPNGGHSLGLFGETDWRGLPLETDVAAYVRLGATYLTPSTLVAPNVPYERLDPYAARAHEADLARAQSAKDSVVLFGDSITSFWGTSPPQGAGLASWQASLAPLGVANFGVSGDLTQNVLWRVRNGELAGHPKVVVLMIGTNDIGFGKSIDSTFRGIAAVVAAVRTASPDSKILVVGVLPRGSNPRDPVSVSIPLLNARLATLPVFQSVFFLNAFTLLSLPDGTAAPAYFRDYDHPNDLGYAILGQALHDALLKLLAPD